MYGHKSIMLKYDNFPMTHVKLVYDLSSFGLRVKFGKSIWGVYDSIPRVSFAVLSELFIPFKEYPEMRELHDGYGWDTEAVLCLIQDLEPEESE